MRVAKKEQLLTFKDMVHIPNAEFNLFSLTKSLDQGYVFGGNRNKIWIEKGTHNIVFDIKSKTPKGAFLSLDNAVTMVLKSHVHKFSIIFCLCFRSLWSPGYLCRP